jgi:O-antigen/teichoic acid export membrane protein
MSMLGSTVALGAVSYLVLGVGARVASADEMSRFLSLWALLNTMVLTVVIPVEHVAPRLRARMSADSASSAVLVHSIVLSAVGTLIALIFGVATASHSHWDAMMFAGAAFGLSVGIWSGRRATLVSGGAFRGVMHRSIVNMVIASVGLVMLLFTKNIGAWVLFVPVIVGNLVGALKVSHGPRRNGGSVRLPMAEYHLLGAMVAATFATLALNNGSLVLGRIWGVEPRTMVVYAALLNLVGVPYMLLNNVMAPLNIRMVALVRDGDREGLLHTALLALSGLVAAVATCAAGSAVLGPFAVRLLAGHDFVASRTFSVGVALSEGAVWLTVVPRLLASALGVSRLLFVCWGLGLAVFIAMGVLPIPADSKLVFAPLVAACVIGVVAVPWILQRARAMTTGAQLL